MYLTKELGHVDRTRLRKADVHEKFYNFLNRSAQSLTRSNSRSERVQRVKDEEAVPSTSTIAHSDRDAPKPRAAHAVASRLPVHHDLSEKTAARRSSTRSPKTLQTAGLSEERRNSLTSPQTKQNVQSPLRPFPSSVYTYSTPPHTRPTSRAASKPTSPLSPTAGIRAGSNSDLLLYRSVTRPLSPSKSPTTVRRVFGIRLSSPSSRKLDIGEDDQVVTSQWSRSYRTRDGSGSSTEPLLAGESDCNPAGSDTRKATLMASPTTEQRPVVDLRSPLPSPSNPDGSFRIARPEEPIDVLASPSRKGTSGLEFWKSGTSRTTSTLNDKDKGKQRAASPAASNPAAGLAELHSPQPRIPATFLPQVPRLQRTPPTPRQNEKKPAHSSPRVDSFMSDSIPLQLPKTWNVSSPTDGRSKFAHGSAGEEKRSQTPAIVFRKPAPAIGPERSRSAPASCLGRISPCLRIPSPKFLSKDREESQREKRRITPDIVGSPILRDSRMHNGEKKARLKAVIAPMRGIAHGSFDFERPGSRMSSKSGSRGTRSDEEKEKEKEKEKRRKTRLEKDNAALALKGGRQTKLTQKAASPVPPLPAQSSTRTPPRYRSQTGTSHGTATHSPSSGDTDDSNLPRLSSSLSRRNGSRRMQMHTAQGSLPPFPFEPPATSSVMPRPSREAANLRAGYIDAKTGLLWAPSKAKENITPEGRSVDLTSPPRHMRSLGNAGDPDVTRIERRNGVAISERELEEATIVITQFKATLDDPGFATLQKYVRRYDAQAIPLEGPSGLLARVQRLLESSAPRTDERRKRQLLESFTRVVNKVS